MDHEIKRPNWSLTMWAIAGCAIIMLAVAIAGSGDPELAATVVKPMG